MLFRFLPFAFGVYQVITNCCNSSSPLTASLQRASKVFQDCKTLAVRAMITYMIA